MKAGAVVLIIASSVTVSCECPIVSCCADVQIGATVWVHDSAGENMISKTKPGYFHPDSIRLFTLDEGRLSSPVVDLNDKEWNFRIDTLQSTGQLYVSLGPTTSSPESPYKTVNVIRWSYTDMDTVEFEVIHKCNNTLLNGLWYNGELIADRHIDVAK